MSKMKWPDKELREAFALNQQRKELRRIAFDKYQEAYHAEDGPHTHGHALLTAIEPIFRRLEEAQELMLRAADKLETFGNEEPKAVAYQLRQGVLRDER